MGFIWKGNRPDSAGLYRACPGRKEVVMSFVLDLDNDTKESVDRGIEPEIGWHRAVCSDVVEDGSSGKTRVEFQIIAGPCKGIKTSEWLNNPDYVESEGGKRMAAQHIKLYASRLGVLPADAIGQKGVEIELMAGIGKEVLIELVENEYVDKAGIKKRNIRLRFDGVFPLDPPHEKIPNDVRQKFGLPLKPEPEGGAGGKGKGKKASGAAPAAMATAAGEVDVSTL